MTVKRTCPWCGGSEAYPLKTRLGFNCKSCGKHSSETSASVFKDRKVSQRQIERAIGLLFEDISVNRWALNAGTTLKTALDWARKIRLAMRAEGTDLGHCQHLLLGKPPKHFRIAACPDCGRLFTGWFHLWEPSDAKVETPFTDLDVANAAIRQIFSHRPKAPNSEAA